MSIFKNFKEKRELNKRINKLEEEVKYWKDLFEVSDRCHLNANLEINACHWALAEATRKEIITADDSTEIYILWGDKKREFMKQHNEIDW